MATEFALSIVNFLPIVLFQDENLFQPPIVWVLRTQQYTQESQTKCYFA